MQQSHSRYFIHAKLFTPLIFSRKNSHEVNLLIASYFSHAHKASSHEAGQFNTHAKTYSFAMQQSPHGILYTQNYACNKVTHDILYTQNYACNKVTHGILYTHNYSRLKFSHGRISHEVKLLIASYCSYAHKASFFVHKAQPRNNGP